MTCAPLPEPGPDGLPAAGASPLSLDPAARDRSLDALADACERCRRCDLAASRQKVVIRRGNPAARLMLIGEGPGAEEDASGLPFVGRSGRLLDALLAAAGLDSQRDAYLCNTVKCRPPGNRRPTRAEMAACRPWLEQQISLVDPRLIVLLGATALEGVLNIRGGITQRRGRWHTGEAEILRGRRLMPILHPSYLLRFNAEAEGSPRALTAADLREVRRALIALSSGVEGQAGSEQKAWS
jgi:uracil-DNA glycosylase